MSRFAMRPISGLWIFTFFLLLTGCGDGPSSPTRSIDPFLPNTPTLPTTSYSISGTITAAAQSAVDADTNDPLSPLAANDTPLAAQALSNPVLLGGYVTAAGTGVSGDRFATDPDIQDWYRVQLAAGQTITLTIADHDGNESNTANPDLDLFLVDSNTQSDVQTSEGSGRQETITVLAGGDYYVQVYTFKAGSNYILDIGQTTPAPLSTALHIEDEFVPGEVIVRFRAPSLARAPGVTALSTTQRAAELGLQLRAGQSGEPMLFRLDAASARPQALAVTNLRSKQTGTVLQQAKRETIDVVKNLRRRADVVSADLNYIRRRQLAPNDASFPAQWNLAQIHMPQAWEITTGDPRVVVAVLDTGVLPAHPDLAGRLCTAADDCRGYDFVADPLLAADGDGLDADPTDPGDKSLASGASAFHGTHIAGILGAAGNNAIGIAGVDWAAKIMPVRIIGVGDGNSYDVMQGVRYAAGLVNDSGTVPARTADILNMSLGGGGFSQAEQDLFNQVRSAGILVVAAAGNDANSQPSYPAAYSGVIAVSAVDIDGNLAPYSNYGPTIDIAAPGGNLATDHNGDGFADGILSASGDDRTASLTYTYVPYMGTSMATAHVAGVVALMKSVYPALTPAEFRALLAAGELTGDLGEDGAAVRNDSFGYGLIDAQKSVLAALALAGGGSLPPSLAIAPSFLNFGGGATTLPLALSNAGGGTLNITGISESVPWITGVALTSESVPGSGLGTYAVSVDRTGLTAGTYTAAINFATDLPSSYTVTVLLQVGASAVADAGFQQIHLLDQNGIELQSIGAAVDAGSGTYPFRFSGLAPGSYRIAAGTDSDHDGRICDPGEACGGYPALANPAIIEITTKDLTGLDFSSSFAADQR